MINSYDNSNYKSSNKFNSNSNSNSNIDLEMGLYNHSYKRLKQQIRKQYYTPSSSSTKHQFTEINLDEQDENDIFLENKKEKCCDKKNKARYFCSNICVIS